MFCFWTTTTSFTDSMLNRYIEDDQYYMNILFHSIQTVSAIAYFATSLMDPGYVTMSQPQKRRVSLSLDLSLMVHGREQHDDDAHASVPRNLWSVLVCLRDHL